MRPETGGCAVLETDIGSLKKVLSVGKQFLADAASSVFTLSDPKRYPWLEPVFDPYIAFYVNFGAICGVPSTLIKNPHL